jgi:xanthine dehydrogenase iron-sulfur cluster and FAD-binding subunit A
MTSPASPSDMPSGWTAGSSARSDRDPAAVAATPLRALATEAALVGQPWNEAAAEAAADVLAAEGTPIDDIRSSAAFRSAMLGQSLLKFYYESTTGALI